jgi:DNA-binding MarR family transcriptional regulator
VGRRHPQPIRAALGARHDPLAGGFLVPTEATIRRTLGRLDAEALAAAVGDWLVARLLGYLAICDPREQSIAELAEALLASRSAIAGAVKTLEQLGLVRRSRAAGERMDRVGIDLTSRRALGFDPTEYQEQAALAREGLAILADAPPERRAVLLEWAAMAEWLVARLPEWEKDWQAHREALRAVGELPGDTTHS